MRLINDEEKNLKNIFKSMIRIGNTYSERKNDENEDTKKISLYNKVKYEPLKEYIRDKDIQSFSEHLKKEEIFLQEQLDLNKGIGRYDLIKENVFLLFLAVFTKISLNIVGKPGSGKALSAKLIYNSMRGKYSKKEFLKYYPQIIQVYYQGSMLKNFLNKLKMNIFKKKEHKRFVPIYDKLGLAEKSPTNSLKVIKEQTQNIYKL